MDQQRVILESSPAYILLCLVLAFGFAFLLYRNVHVWSKTWNWILFSARFVLSFLLLFLLLGPIVKQIRNLIEKPVFVVLYDNSISVKESTDSLLLLRVKQALDNTEQMLTANGYQVKRSDLSGREIEQLTFDESATDLNSALKKISNVYEGQRVAGVIMSSDGIYNKGVSPLYGNYNFPVYTVGLGDTVERTDAAIKNIAYNKIAYEGNKYPVRVEVLAKNLKSESLSVTLSQGGKVLEKQTKNTGNEELIVYDFQTVANVQGIQKLDIQVEIKPGEYNTRNNASSIFVEVVAGKKQILLISGSPHPDVKALREVIEKNSNYEFILHIPGIKEAEPSKLNSEKIDLVILHQSPDLRGRTLALFQKFVNSKTSLFFIVGQQTDLRALAQNNMPLKFEIPPREYDQVTPVFNAAFSSFILSPEASSVMVDYPPVSVHFGRLKIPLTATSLLYQRVGSVATEKPLLAVDIQDGRKIAVMLGEGLWRWRLNEFDRSENTTGFDELFGKLIQYMSTTEDKRRFRSYPTQQEFAHTESVVFESQVYNEIFEPVYGNAISIELTDEQGKKNNYSYVTSPGNSRYQIGGLNEGIYKYRARTSINDKPEEARGEFAVVERQAELLNLTADFDMLRKLSANTGGKFYNTDQLNSLDEQLAKAEATGIIHSEEVYNTMVNMKSVFWILITLISVEWFARKFFGSY